MTSNEIRANEVVSQAIETSVRENRIVHIGFDDVCGGMTLSALSAESDDSATNGDEIEYWGTTEDGAEWRVHAEHTDGAVSFAD